MNAIDGAELERIFFAHYERSEITDITEKDKRMLDKLSRAGHTEFIFDDGRAFAQATQTGRDLYCPPSE